MDKLDKVIRALNCCLSDAECDFGCPYWVEGEDGEDSACELMKKDALRILTMWDVIHKDIWDRTYEIVRLKKKLKQVEEELRMKDELLEVSDSSLKALRAWREMSEVIVHAHWVGDPGDWRCSHCREYAPDGGFEQTKRCPHCGAHMDEEVV